MNTDKSLTTSILRLALATAALLLVPLIAMQFTEEVTWTLSDFLAAGTLLFGTGLMYVLVTQILARRMAGNIVYRVAIGFALFTGLFLIWVNLAVGIIGSEDNPINLFYFGVIAVGLIGSFMARFQPDKMVLTMFAMALTQAMIAVIALVGGYYQSPPSSVIEILGVNGFFIILFTVSALLFRYVIQEESPSNPAG